MVDAVVDEDEVAALAAVGHARLGRLEQGDLAPVDGLMITVPGHARHPALVPLVGTVDVEELQARPTAGDRAAGPEHFHHPRVEIVLALAVEVERAEPIGMRPVVEPQRSVAVGGGAGGIDEGRRVRGAPPPEPLRVLDVVSSEVVPVGLGGIAARPEVEDRLDHQAAGSQGIGEFEVPHETGPRHRGQIGQLGLRRRVVDQEERPADLLGQPPGQIRPDEARGSGHGDHGRVSIPARAQLVEPSSAGR